MQGKIAILVVALLLSGCHAAETRRLLYGPDPVARKPAEPLRSVAVSTVQRTTYTDYSQLSIMLRRGEQAQRGDEPSPLTENAARGAAIGAAAGLIVGVSVAALFCSNPILAGACPSAARLALQGAAQTGAFAGLETIVRGPVAVAVPQAAPPGGFEKARDATSDALQSVNLQIALRNAVELRIRELTLTKFSESNVPGPQTTWDQPNYRSLAAQGHDAVLELNMVRAALSRPDLLGNMTLDLRARAKLVSTVNEEIIYQDTFSWSSPGYTAVQWTEDEAARLRAALLAGLDDLGRQISAGAFAPEHLAR